MWALYDHPYTVNTGQLWRVKGAEPNDLKEVIVVIDSGPKLKVQCLDLFREDVDEPVTSAV